MSKKLMAFVLTLILVFSIVPSVAFAAKGDVPKHSKSSTPNGDGTYKIELTVTGDAEDKSESDTHVNVLIIYDESSSMTNDRPSRADQAEDAMYGFVNGLVGYQNRGVDIYMAEVGFGTGSNIRQNWTKSLTTIRGHFDEGPEDGTITGSSHGNYGYNGTNWSSAFSTANGLLNDLSDIDGTDRSAYPTFVVLVTDGGPTAGGNGGTTVPGATVPWTSYRNHYLAAVEAAHSIQSRTNTTLYGIYAFGTDANLLDDLMYYANNGSHRTVDGYSIEDATQTQHDFAADEGADHYYTAENATALNAAINEIFNEIVEAMGISEVSMSDGTTSKVTASSGEISSLLGVDEDSYQYWMSIPTSGNKFTRKKNVEGSAEEITYSVTDNGDGTCTVSWTEGGASKTVKVNGTAKNDVFKFEWTAEDFPNDFYEYAPNKAKLTDGAVDWDLSNVDTLLDGVTYSITFDVYPSQTTLDIVADIKNDPGETGAWAKLDPEIQKYIDVNGDLETNTTATLTYIDTREDAPYTEHSTAFDNPPAVSSTAVEELAISKKWENELDSQEAKEVTLVVTRDGKDTYTVKLNKDNNWENTVFISIGIIKDGKALAGSEGHDFTFKEPDDLTYHWELDVPVVHPMLIDNKPVMLIKVDDKHQPESGATTYKIGDSTYYVDEEGAASLTATNFRRSSLILTKAVDGEDVPEDAVFPFTLNVVNSLAPEKEPENDLGSDYWVWISVRDMSETDDPDKAPPVNDAVVSGATPEDGSNGWYYAPSGKPVVINMKPGYSVRVNNLPTDSTYTITEGDMPADFSFESAELVIADGEGADSTFKGGQTTTGTIGETNTLYKVVYTNSYESSTPKPCIGDPPVVKELKGDTPEKAETFTFKLTAVSTTAEGLSGKMPMPEAANGAQEMTMDVTEIGKAKEFGEFELTVPGVYTYEITEVAGSAEGYTYSKEKHTIVYTVTKNDDNSLKCVKTVDGVEISGKETDEANVTKFVFTNEYKKPAEPEKETVDVKVSKVWKDDNNAELTRPSSVTVKLLADGKDTGKTLELSKATEWAGTFEGLDKYDADGKEIKYTVDEAKVPEGYEAKVEGDISKGLTITNSLVEEEEVPPTGDTSGIFFWSGLSMTSLLGLGYLFLKRRKEEQ